MDYWNLKKSPGMQNAALDRSKGLATLLHHIFSIFLLDFATRLIKFGNKACLGCGKGIALKFKLYGSS